jgi:transposase
LVADLESWMRKQRAKLSRGNGLAKAMEYMLKRWTAFTRFLDDWRIRIIRSPESGSLSFVPSSMPDWFTLSSKGQMDVALCCRRG